MILDSVGLVAGFVLILALLLLMLFYTKWPYILKIIMVAGVACFFYIGYLSIPSFFGWPTKHDRPEKLRLIAIYIEAPHRIYLWGQDLAYGIEGQRPRAYEFVYTTKLNDSLNKAAHKLKKGFPMIAEIKKISATQLPKGQADVVEREEYDLVIYDVPEALAPNLEK